MALTTSAAYAAANANLERTPVYRATFTRNSVVVGRFSTHKITDYVTEVMADAPSLWLRFNEASGTVMEDSSGNNLNGTYFNTPTLGAAGLIEGSSNKAVTFNAVDEYATVPDNPLLDPGDAFTWMGWLNITGPSLGNNYTLIDKGVGGYRIWAGTFGNSGNLVLEKNGTGTITFGAINFSLSALHHFAVTKNGSAVNLYIDGADVTSTVTNQTIVATATDLNIARKANSSEYMPGTLDEITLYPTALSAARVAAHYNAGLAGHPSSLWLPYMKLPRGVESQVIPEHGQTSIGSITMPIEDVNGVVTALISGDGIGGDEVTFEAGFDGLQGEEFQAFMVGRPEGCKLFTDLTGYEITIRDPQTLLNRQAFNVSASPLVGYHSADRTTIQVVDNTDFLPDGYLRIDNELMSYAAKGSSGTPIDDRDWTGLAFGANSFVSVMDDSGIGDGRFSRSYSGGDWVVGGLFAEQVNVVGFGQGVLFALGGNGNSGQYTSSDGGVTWSANLGGTGAGQINTRLVYAAFAGKWLTVATSGPTQTWIASPGNAPTTATGVSGTARGIAVNESAGVVIAVGASGDITKSTNGTSFTAKTSAEANTLEGAAYDIAHGRFVAVSSDGTNRIQWSDDDGETWNAVASPEQNELRDIIYIDEKERLVAFASSGTNRVIYSDDGGDTWTAVAAATANQWTRGTFGNGIIVSTAITGTGTRSMYSLDYGETWIASASIVTFTGVTRGISIGSSITEAAEHAATTTVGEILRLGPDHPMGLSGAILALTDKRGLSIDAAFIDVAGINAIGVDIGAGNKMEFLIDAPVNGKTWFEREFFAPLGLYLRITGDGKLSLVRFAEPVTAVGAVNHDNIVSDASGYPILTWDQNLASVINAVTVYFDFDLISGEFKSSLEFTDAASITKFGRKPLGIESKGFRSALSGTADLIEAVATTILERYANGAPLVTARVFLQDHLIEAGDIIALTSALLPDRNTGLRGVTDALVEVTGRTIVFDSHYVDLSMLWTGWNL